MLKMAYCLDFKSFWICVLGSFLKDMSRLADAVSYEKLEKFRFQNTIPDSCGSFQDFLGT